MNLNEYKENPLNYGNGFRSGVFGFIIGKWPT